MSTENKGRIVVSIMTASAVMIFGIANYEGFSSTAYKPLAEDVPTIGYGSTTKPDGSPVRMTDKPITRTEAMQWLKSDVKNKYESGVKRCVKVPLYQHEYDAYVSLTYNIGVGAFCGSTLVRKLNQRDYAGACAQILRWDRFKGRQLRGLTNRRRAEYKMCMGG